MQANVWLANKNRAHGDYVSLIQPDNDANRFSFKPDTCLAFYWQREGRKEKVIYLNLSEVAKGIFQLDVLSFDNTFNDGHIGIKINFETGNSINFTDETFKGEQYSFLFETGIYDIASLSRRFFDTIKEYESVGMINTGERGQFYETVINKITQTFSGKLKP